MVLYWPVSLLGFFFSLDVAFFLITTTGVPTGERFLQKLSNIMFVLLIPYGLGRAIIEKVKLTDTTVSYLVQSCNICISLGSVHVGPARSVNVQVMLLLGVLALTDLPYWKLQCTTLLPAILISFYNATFGSNGYSMILIVTPETGLFRDIVAQSKVFWIMPLSMIMVRTLSTAYYTTLRRLEGAVTIAKRVSEHLAEYNTKAAEQVLREYSSYPNCDLNLYSVLSVIVEDMNTYKPYLPNYVVSTEEVEGDENPAPSRERSSLRNVIVPPSAGSITTGTAVPSLTSGESRITRHSRGPLRMIGLIPTRRRITYALIHFVVESVDVIDNPHPLRQFIDRVYRYANTSKGAVHSCICDTVHMTWNAVTSVAQSEQWAVRSLQVLDRSLDFTTSSRVEVHGSVMTGLAEFRMTGTVHLTFLLSISWWKAQQALYMYARRVGTNVVCKETAREIREITMNVDVLDDEDSTEVYELTSCDIYDKYGLVTEAAVKALKENNIDLAKRYLNELEDCVSERESVPQSIESLKLKVLRI
eukprot:PhF_6_TR28137/c0_g1_i5/m.41664